MLKKYARPIDRKLAGLAMRGIAVRQRNRIRPEQVIG
jgi:hypothetical protein